MEPWEQLKIGGGTPPILTRHGWLMVYHGVQKITEPGGSISKLCYSAGIMVLSETRPNFILYRAADPVLEPASTHERRGTVDNVVFAETHTQLAVAGVWSWVRTSYTAEFGHVQAGRNLTNRDYRGIIKYSVARMAIRARVIQTHRGIDPRFIAFTPTTRYEAADVPNVRSEKSASGAPCILTEAAVTFSKKS